MPSRKRATPINLASAIRKSSSGGPGPSTVAQRPFRDRVLHLLALRPYRKAELLLRLQRDGLAQADKDALDGLLQQVGATVAGAWVGPGGSRVPPVGSCVEKHLHSPVLACTPGYSSPVPVTPPG